MSAGTAAPPTRRTHIPLRAYGFWRVHVRLLVREAGLDDPGDVLADVLLAPVASELYQDLRARDRTRWQVRAALPTLAHQVLRPTGAAGC